MSITSDSRSMMLQRETPTMADVLAQISADQDLTARRRQDMASAIRTLAKALDKTLSDLPAHPGFLRHRLKAFSPIAAGLTPTRWANTLSLVRASLKRLGLSHMPGRYTQPMAPAWAELTEKLDNRMLRFSLSRLARYCTVQAIHPEKVNDGVMAAFLTDMGDAALTGVPRDVHRRACLAWNTARAIIPDWPAAVLTVPSYVRSYVVPWQELPATLRSDIEAFLKHLAGGDIFEERDFKPLRAISIATRRRQLHGFVSALIRTGHGDQLHSLADVVDPSRAKDALRFIIDHARGGVTAPSPTTGHVQVHQTTKMLCSVAKYWVKSDSAIVVRLTTIGRNLDPDQRGLRDGNRLRLRQFDDPEAVGRFVQMPLRLLAAAQAIKRPTPKTATLVQLAVMVDLLQMAPIRLKNLAGLEIDRTILRSRGGVWRISFLGPETKNGEPIDITLPVESGRLIDIYVRSYRAILLHGNSQWLFPGREAGTAKSPDMLRTQIKNGMARHCGLEVNPHLFRHIAAKLYLEANPGAYGVVRLALGHRSMATTVENYCGTEAAAAFAHFEANVLRLREDAAKPSPPRRPRGGNAS